MPRMIERIEDFRRFGVPALWVIDPASRQGFDYSPEGLAATDRLSVPGRPIYLDLAALFADLD